MSTQRESWLALTVEDALEPGMPICDPASPFLGPRRGPVFARPTHPRCGRRPQHRPDRVHRVPLHVPGTRPRGDAFSRRGRVCPGHRRPKRQRTIWDHGGCLGYSRQTPISCWERLWSRFWKLTSRPAITVSGASGSPAPGTPAPRSPPAAPARQV